MFLVQISSVFLSCLVISLRLCANKTISSAYDNVCIVYLFSSIPLIQLFLSYIFAINRRAMGSRAPLSYFPCCPNSFFSLFLFPYSTSCFSTTLFISLSFSSLSLIESSILLPTVSTAGFKLTNNVTILLSFLSKYLFINELLIYFSFPFYSCLRNWAVLIFYFLIPILSFSQHYSGSITKKSYRKV